MCSCWSEWALSKTTSNHQDDAGSLSGSINQNTPDLLVILTNHSHQQWDFEALTPGCLDKQLAQHSCVMNGFFTAVGVRQSETRPGLLNQLGKILGTTSEAWNRFAVACCFLAAKMFLAGNGPWHVSNPYSINVASRTPFMGGCLAHLEDFALTRRLGKKKTGDSQETSQNTRKACLHHQQLFIPCQVPHLLGKNRSARWPPCPPSKKEPPRSCSTCSSPSIGWAWWMSSLPTLGGMFACAWFCLAIFGLKKVATS